jgi:hypothetical protein
MFVKSIYFTACRLVLCILFLHFRTLLQPAPDWLIRNRISQPLKRSYSCLCFHYSVVESQISAVFLVVQNKRNICPTLILLIIQKMFNLETDDLALKPYIPQKKYFYEFVDDIGIFIFDLHGGC